MKLILIFILFICTNTDAQEMPSGVINSCGGLHNGTTAKLIASIGEPVVGRIGSAGAVSLHQGFLLAKYSGSPSPLGTGSYAVYPNPAQDILKIKGNGAEVTHCAIFNMLGQRISILPVINNEVMVGEILPGAYIVTLMDRRKNRMATFSFIKK